MREIKFRAWDGKYFEYMMEADEGEHFWAMVSLHKWPVQQYTGLEDKNGKPIFEGDWVIKTRDDDAGGNHRQPFKVHWQPSNCGWNLRNPGGKANKYHYEVIGNIYENPELLK